MNAATLDPTPATEATATPTETAPATQPVGTVPENTGGQATAQGAPADTDTFTKVDVNTLNAKDREAYNNMLRDYKAKTAEIASQRKQFEGINLDEMKQKASLYDQAIEQARLAQGKTEEEARQAELNQLWQEAQSDPQKAIEFHRRIAEMEVEKVRESVNQMQAEKMEADSATFVDAFADAVDPKTGEPLRPDYDDVNRTGLVNHFFNEFIADKKDLPAKEWPKAMEYAWNNAKKTYDDVFQKGYQAAVAKLQTKVAGSSELPSGGVISSERALSRSDAAKLTVKEAVELARQGIKIKTR